MNDDVPSSLLAKVRKLLAKAEATDNANEAEAFSAKAAELIAVHRIDTARLAPGDAEARLAVRAVPVGRGAYVRGRLALLGAVATTHDCELVWQSGPDGTTALLAGFGDDLDATIVLYESLHLQAAARMAAVRRATPAATQRWRRAFLFGFASRVGDLLADARRHAEDEVVATGSTLPDLPNRAEQVRAYAAGSFGRVVAARVPSPAVAGGWDQGHRARGRRPRTPADGRSPGDRQGLDVTTSARCSTSDVGREAVYTAEEAALGGTDLDVLRPFAALVDAGRGRDHRELVAGV